MYATRILTRIDQSHVPTTNFKIHSISQSGTVT